MPHPLDWIDKELDALAARDLRRERRWFDRAPGGLVRWEGRELVNFGSNDYLGLAADPRLGAAVAEAIERTGWGSGSSALVCGRTALHVELERQLAEFEDCEAAILFASGYAANTGAIAALVGRGDAVFSDAKNHASIVDGCRLSRADVHVYRHVDPDHLDALLRDSHGARRRLIATDSLFSMDGNLAPLADIAQLAEKHGAMLLVDEAHATGVFGERGRGVAEHLGVEDAVDIRIGTLSKALGCAGGFVAGRRSLVEWLANRARSYVFSTAPPPATSAAALAALDIVRTEPQRRRTLLARAESLRTELAKLGWNTGASASQIIPLLVGDAALTMQLADQLAAAGYFVPGIRPPTVPDGESLLRISLSFVHEERTMSDLVANCDNCRGC